MKLKKKLYLLRLDNNMWIEVEKYSKDNCLHISNIIRKAIKDFFSDVPLNITLVFIAK